MISNEWDFSEIPHGSSIMLMASDDVDIPLWGSAGLLFTDATELLAFGVSPKLAGDLQEWARTRNAAFEVPAELHLQAIDIVNRMTQELNHDYVITYKP